MTDPTQPTCKRNNACTNPPAEGKKWCAEHIAAHNGNQPTADKQSKADPYGESPEQTAGKRHYILDMIEDARQALADYQPPSIIPLTNGSLVAALTKTYPTRSAQLGFVARVLSIGGLITMGLVGGAFLSPDLPLFAALIGSICGFGLSLLGVLWYDRRRYTRRFITLNVIYRQGSKTKIKRWRVVGLDLPEECMYTVHSERGRVREAFLWRTGQCRCPSNVNIADCQCVVCRLQNSPCAKDAECTHGAVRYYPFVPEPTEPEHTLMDYKDITRLTDGDLINRYHKALELTNGAVFGNDTVAPPGELIDLARRGIVTDDEEASNRLLWILPIAAVVAFVAALVYVSDGGAVPSLPTIPTEMPAEVPTAPISPTQP